MRRKRIADEFGPGWQPSDFVEEAYGDYEPKGAGESIDPKTRFNSLEEMERSGELKRQSMGLAPRDVELRRQQGDHNRYPTNTDSYR